MDIDNLIRIAAVVLAGIILLSTVDILSVLKGSVSWIKLPKWSTPKVAPEAKEETEFLEIVDLWYKLKHSCDSYNLKEAAEKLDEVFPLLNVEK